MIKKILALCILAFVFSVPSSVLAQTADGPFYSKDQLVNYWVQNKNSAIEVALNGYIVYSAIGVGPANVLEYYRRTDGTIRTYCSDLQGPFYNKAKALEGMKKAGISGQAYLDGVGTNVPVSPIGAHIYYKTCPGDTMIYDH